MQILTDQGPISVNRLFRMLRNVRSLAQEIDALSEAESVAQADDYVPIYDASGDVVVKVKLANLGF